MRYSLTSRFKGTILGAIIGEQIASSRSKQLQGAGTLKIPSLHWSDMAILCAESLISKGRLDTQDWQKPQQQEFTKLKNSYEAILATLPVALFFHDNTVKLRQNLLLATEIWQDDPVVRDGTLAVGYAIAKSLTEKLSPQALISQTISFVGETQTNLPQQLLEVHNLLEYGAGLETVQAELGKEQKLSNIIALAFYCFLSTIEDFRLSVLRAIQDNYRSCAIGAMTGALSGAYNSAVGIPVTWQVMLVQQSSAQDWKRTGSSKMVELADAIVAVWSGVYNLASHPDKVREESGTITPPLLSLQVTAAPRVIRSR
ncbi:ADP-ribosylglycohydrolase family protein [Brasilonema bromeliae]|uniref:ADP-ribosylglycohydrolase family protein n=1 Tax=Brasilonema bromeliae SPC951 TaxID=385972 RepID=A0ABX1PB62_9CYAN|nr:ADP-ribosylglycohydrolase family protein [Brasilonema bromeliae]NMG21690.1 ADP-ribosylglycohydrolase family protein [Brasilonema bromeliae SPC951]